MKSQHLTIILFFTFFFSNVNAQEFKLGKVTIAELQEKSHPKDSSAVAAILFKTGSVYFDDLITITQVRTKIKIYKKEGYEWANEVISHYIDGENISFHDANTYNLVDGKIEKTKLKSDGEFEQNVNRYFSQTKITMPNVKEACIIEYEYVIRSGNFGSLRDWYFQSSIPVNYSEYKVKLPKFLTFNKKSKGFLFPKLSSEPTYNQEISEVYKLENIPAMKDEVFVNNIDNYRSSISHELAMVSIPGSYYKTFSTDWESVTKTIYEESDFGDELNKTGYFEDDIKALIKDLKTREETIDAIFNFVKSRVKWNDYDGYSCNDGVKNAYKDKTGNVAEINLMLTAMLRYAGLNANPVLVSTRSNGIAMFPSHSAFNHVIAAIELDDSQILLDATEKYAMPNVLPSEDLNWFGRLIRKDGTSTQVNLMPKILSREAINMSIILKSDGSAEGKIRRQLTDHEALEFRKKNLVTSKDSYLEELENLNNNTEISDYLRENDLDLSKPIVESYSFKDTKDIEVINNKIYVSPMLFFTAKENPFKQEVREYPIDFGYPTQNKYNISIEIPEGYIVESMPAPINIVTGDNIAAFKFVIVNIDNKIQVAITSTINTAIVASDFYPVLKGFYQQMIDKQNEKIVLKKI
jgi:hypothetical protein